MQSLKFFGNVWLKEELPHRHLTAWLSWGTSSTLYS